MYLHKYKTDDGTFYLISSKVSPGDITFNLSKPMDTISGESVKNFLSNIENKFKEEPPPEEAEKKEEPEKEPEKPRKATYAEILRQYAGVIKQYASTLKD
jgi:hypothetical protein